MNNIETEINEAPKLVTLLIISERLRKEGNLTDEYMELIKLKKLEFIKDYKIREKLIEDSKKLLKSNDEYFSIYKKNKTPYTKK